MAPLALQFCASIFIVMNNPDIVEFYEDGTAGVNPDAFRSIANSVGTLELISVGIAILLVFFYIYNAPRVGTVPATATASQGGAQPSLNRTPDIMTVAEAAAYMRVTEAEVLDLIDRGKLGAARIGSTYRIARIAIEDFMRQA
jgi:excisionase family DNA binding protein